MPKLNKYFEPCDVIRYEFYVDTKICKYVTLKLSDGVFIHLQDDKAKGFKFIESIDGHEAVADWIIKYGQVGLLEDCKGIIKW